MLKESPRYLVEAIAFLGIVGSMVYVIGSGAGVTETAGLLVLYGVAGFRLVPAMYRIYNGVSNFSFARAVFDAITDDLAVGESAAFPPSDVAPLPLCSSVRLQGIRFRYQTSSSDVLPGLDLEIRANESIALVGSTGAGKTTLVDILLGLLQPSAGSICVDGVPIDDRSIDGWRASIGYVPQSIFLADASILRNIAFGRNDGEIDRDAAVTAAKTAHLHDFVTALPQGYDTETGERGVRLSGGQRQRIGIARALYRKPRILVLDEATSALDGITESIISEAIRDLHGQVTLIIIAHRLTTVRHCDTIYMMDKGRIVDHGTYDELIGRSATFRAMAGVNHA
jgi:ABC-type multidrug transport system fused ATPase/permease subunit